MQELLEAAFFGVNIPYTVLFLILILYWFTVLLGIFNIDSFDVDMDADMDIDLDLDADGGTVIDLDAGVEPLESVEPHLEVHKIKPKYSWQRLPWYWRLLVFFNIGRVPLMIFLSFASVFMWAGAILTHHYIGQNSFSFAFIWALPNIFIAMFLSKILTYPLIPIFKEDKVEFETNEDMIGKIGKVVLPATNKTIGQVNIKGNTGVFVTLNVLATEGNQLKNSSQALIIAYDEERKLYMAEPFNH